MRVGVQHRPQALAIAVPAAPRGEPAFAEPSARPPVASRAAAAGRATRPCRRGTTPGRGRRSSCRRRPSPPRTSGCRPPPRTRPAGSSCHPGRWIDRVQLDIRHPERPRHGRARASISRSPSSRPPTPCAPPEDATDARRAVVGHDGRHDVRVARPEGRSRRRTARRASGSPRCSSRAGYDIASVDEFFATIGGALGLRDPRRTVSAKASSAAATRSRTWTGASSGGLARRSSATDPSGPGRRGPPDEPRRRDPG